MAVYGDSQIFPQDSKCAIGGDAWASRQPACFLRRLSSPSEFWINPHGWKMWPLSGTNESFH